MEAQKKCIKTGTPCGSILQMENFNIKMMQVQGDSAIALVEETDEIEAGGRGRILYCSALKLSFAFSKCIPC